MGASDDQNVRASSVRCAGHLNGHEYVAAAAQAAGIGFAKEGNCFTRITDPPALAQIADTLSQPATIGRLTQVCDRWIYTACLCFGLDLDEQERHRQLAEVVWRYGHGWIGRVGLRGLCQAAVAVPVTSFHAVNRSAISRRYSWAWSR